VLLATQNALRLSVVVPNALSSVLENDDSRGRQESPAIGLKRPANVPFAFGLFTMFLRLSTSLGILLGLRRSVKVFVQAQCITEGSVTERPRGYDVKVVGQLALPA